MKEPTNEQKLARKLEELNKRIEEIESSIQAKEEAEIQFDKRGSSDDYYKNYIEELESKVKSLQRHCNNAVYVYLYQLRSNIEVWGDVRKLRKQLQEDLSQARKNAQT